MRQRFLRPFSGAVLAIILASAFTHVLVSAQGSEDEQGKQLQSAQELQDVGRSEKSRQSSANARKLEGVWEAQVTRRNCQTGDPIITFRGVSTFIRGGALVGTNANPNPPISLGRWQYLGGQRYSSVERFFRYNPDGSFAGVQRITRNFALSQDGDHFTGTISVEIFDVNDNLIATGCATETTKRVE